MRVKLFIIFSFLLASIVLYSCSSSNSSNSGVVSQTVTTGQYSFTVWNVSGIKLMSGILNIDSVSSDNVYGTYSRSMLYDSTFPGANMLGGGKLTGKYNSVKSDITLNMTPNVADNNIYFTGKTYTTSIKGDWRKQTMTSTKKEGKFRAVLK
jgi:hypothetical protein